MGLSSSSSSSSSSSFVSYSSPFLPSSSSSTHPFLLVRLTSRLSTVLSSFVSPSRLYSRLRLLCHCSTSLCSLLFLCSFLSFSAGSVLLALLAAPILTSLMIVTVSLALAFVFTESSAMGVWHHSVESENRFWTGISALFVASLLFAPDSPLAWGLTWPLLSAHFVAFSALYVHHHDRRLSRVQLTRPPHLRRVSSLLLNDQESARAKLKQVNAALEALDFKFVLMKPLSVHGINSQELAIVEIFEHANDEELNFLAANANLSLLFYKLKDRDVMTWNRAHLQARTRLMGCLCQERLHSLHTAARVNIIDALMGLRLKAHSNAIDWLANVFLNTHGRALTRLKTACDAKGTIASLHRLIFRDVHDLAVRERILAHIEQEAKLLLSDPHHQSLKRRKILSDIDDTLFSSGGRWPAGIDNRYPPRSVYPGVLSFFKEIDLGMHGGEWRRNRQGNLCFLSARPSVYKGAVEARTYVEFEKLRVQKTAGLHCVPTMLAGSVESGWKMIIHGDCTALAVTKAKAAFEFSRLYPEFSFVFVGDNGQGDAIAASLIQSKLGERLEAVFIHQIQPIQLTPGFRASNSTSWADFHFFHTYLGASLHACHLNLFDHTGLVRIGASAITRLVEFQKVLSVTEWEHRRSELNRDIDAVNDYLRTRTDCSTFLQPILSEREHPLGSKCLTRFGKGIIRNFEPINAIYHIELLEWRLARNAPAFLYQHRSEVRILRYGTVGMRVCTSIGFTGTIERIRPSTSMFEISLTSWKLSNSFAKCYAPAHEVVEIIASINELVYCPPFGHGIVRKYRVHDGIYEVALKLNGELITKSSFFNNKLALSSKLARMSHSCNTMLYTVGANMKRVDEDESRCSIM